MCTSHSIRQRMLTITLALSEHSLQGQDDGSYGQHKAQCYSTAKGRAGWTREDIQTGELAAQTNGKRIARKT